MSSQKPIITFRATVSSSASPAAVYALLVKPATHLQWAGEQASDKAFRLLTLDAAGEPAVVGTTFVSTGAGDKKGAMTFHDTSTVTEATPFTAFAFDTDAELVRKRRPPWHARFVHRYGLAPDGSGTVVSYTCDVYPLNYRPYWLHPLARPATGRMIPRMMRKNMENLARMAEKAGVEASLRD
jgi:hypothetical protein